MPPYAPPPLIRANPATPRNSHQNTPGAFEYERHAHELHQGEDRRDGEHPPPAAGRGQRERQQVRPEDAAYQRELRHGPEGSSQGRGRELSEVDGDHHRGKPGVVGWGRGGDVGVKRGTYKRDRGGAVD